MNFRIQMKNRLGQMLFACVAMWALTACSMMETDRTDCPSGLYVSFVYDYNIQRADMFKDHVGEVTLYVFDESGKLVVQRSVGNEGDYAPLRTYGYTMHFTNEELPAGRYRLVAVAQQNRYESSLTVPGAKFRRADMTKGSSADDLTVTLDRRPDPETQLPAVDNLLPLDTLWVGTTLNPDGRAEKLGEEWVEVNALTPAYTTVYLVRDTKNLNIVLRQLDNPTNLSEADYEVTVTAENGRIGHDNALLQDVPLLYRPYAQWTAEQTSNQSLDWTGDNGQYRTAHYDLSLSRLVCHEDDPAQNAQIRIYNKKEQRDVLRMDLTELLAQGRTSQEIYRYSKQEFLDREYNYKLEVVLKGAEWQYLTLTVSVLGWTKRIQNTSL